MLASKTAPFTNFVFSMPDRIITFFIVYVAYVNINNRKNLVLNMIWKEKRFFKKVIFIQTIIGVCFLSLIYYLFIINNILKGLSVDARVFIVFLFPILIVLVILLPWFIIYTIKLRQANKLKDVLGEKSAFKEED